MIKRLLLLLLLAPCAWAQNPTQVSGTITDSNTIAYYPAQVTACLSPVTLDPLVGGKHVNPNIGANYCIGPVPTAANGAFSMGLHANANITPAATTWIFTVTALGSAPPAGTGAQTFQSSGITISGTSQDVGATLSTLAPKLTAGAGGVTPVPGTINPASTTYNAKFDARWKADGALTSGLPTVTSATIAFVQADVGKKIYTINSANGLTRLNGTILSVESATSATASVNASATESTSGIVVCTDDTTAITTAWTDALNQNKLLVLPSGATCVTNQLFAATGTSFPRGTNFSVQGSGPGTVLIIPPDFNFACAAGSGGCIYGVTTQQFVFPDGIHSWPQVGNFTVTMLGSICSGCVGNKKLFTVGSGGGAVYHDIVFANYCSVQSNTTMFELNQEDRAYNLNLQGNTCVNTNRTVAPIIVAGAAVEIFAPVIAYTEARAIQFATGSGDSTVHGGLLVSTGSSPGNNPHSYVSLVNANNVHFIGTRITNTASSTNGWDVDPTSNLVLDGVDCVNSAAASSACVNVQAGGIAKVGRYSQFQTSGGAVPITNLGTVSDDNTNTYGTGTSTGIITTCPTVTGAGATGSCAAVAGSTNEKGTLRITVAGAGPAALGTVTMNFAGTFAGATGTTPSCTFTPALTGGGAWNARATTFLSTRSTTAPVITWDNNAAVLTATTWDIDYVCGAR